MAFNIVFVLLVFLQIAKITLSDDLTTTYRTLEGKSKRYFFMDFEKVNWFRARKFCGDNGMQLLSIESEREDSLILNRIIKLDLDDLGELSLKNWWTSGNDLVDARRFMWGDFQRMFYTNWQDGEPNNLGDGNKTENCVELIYTDGNVQWNDAQCSNANYFICEYYVQNNEQSKPRSSPEDKTQVISINPRIPYFPTLFYNGLTAEFMNKTYYFSSNLESHEDALNFCRERGMSLISNNIESWNIYEQKLFLFNMEPKNTIWLRNEISSSLKFYCAQVIRLEYHHTARLVTIYVDCKSKGNTVCVKNNIS